jgi:predicted DNA binding protein
MREAVVGVYHQDCWGSGSTERFPLVSMSEIGAVSIVEKSKKGVLVNASWKLRAPNENELGKYLEYLRTVKSIKKLEVISKHEKTAFFITQFLSPTSSYDTILKSKCVPVAPIVQEGGFEIHSVICDKPRDISKLLGGLEQIGEIKIFRIGKFKPEENKFNLTDKQQEALRTALLYDYYSWPRKVTLEELSKTIGSNRRTFQENLRRAESKVLPSMLKSIMKEHN